ncbi:hypothetical protein O7635_36765 [Asanoa sp. WMMD1127]|uniref:hypothetical protein n=1 Tax=Asanoa sp. WMMD1127 TaxID=3016107 RepID=UPI00241736A8|nr:hypothetical protein [Asanoa sp. WMMD1127]MDG4827428.1 hypothetical protein [Asanoa sp. WMMD1127]
MLLTTDLATTGAQVVPVLAIGAVVAFRARVRAHEQMAQPLRTSISAFSRKVVELHQNGVRGQALLDAIAVADAGGGRSLSVGTVYVLRVLGVVAVLTTILANLAAEVICLLVLGGSVAPSAGHAVFVMVAITAGLALLVVVPLLSNMPTWGLSRAVLRTADYERARKIIEQAAAEVAEGPRSTG